MVIKPINEKQAKFLLERSQKQLLIHHQTLPIFSSDRFFDFTRKKESDLVRYITNEIGPDEDLELTKHIFSPRLGAREISELEDERLLRKNLYEFNFQRYFRPFRRNKAAPHPAYQAALDLEKEALELYAKIYKPAFLHTMGVFINPKLPWFKVQPDGLAIDDNGNFKLIEVKSCNAAISLKQLNWNLETLKKKKPGHYAQIQFSLYLFNFPECALIYIHAKTKEIKVINIKKDLSYIKKLFELYDMFWFDKFIPKMQEYVLSSRFNKIKI